MGIAADAGDMRVVGDLRWTGRRVAGAEDAAAGGIEVAFDGKVAAGAIAEVAVVVVEDVGGQPKQTPSSIAEDMGYQRLQLRMYSLLWVP